MICYVDILSQMYVLSYNIYRWIKESLKIWLRKNCLLWTTVSKILEWLKWSHCHGFLPYFWVSYSTYYFIYITATMYIPVFFKIENAISAHWFQMAFRVQFNFPRFPQLLAGLNNDFRVGHDVGNPQKWTLMNPSANMGSSLDTKPLYNKNWKMCTTEIGL